ncbi:hypothetical protein PTKIN_Ptkin05aG0223500 [Pterospermum kingtungense]
MTKRYTILQKKLKELESKLDELLSVSPETPYHQRLCQDIQQRFLFLKKILSAEISSRPRRPYHLQHIAQRLLELEAAWDNFQTSAPDDHVDKDSTCSCRNDDGDAAEGSSDDLEQVAEAASAELSLGGLDLEGFDDRDRIRMPLPLAVENFEIAKRKEDDDEAERSMTRNGVWYGKCLGTLTTGVLLGMLLMAVFMVALSGCFHCYTSSSDYTFCLTPT